MASPEPPGDPSQSQRGPAPSTSATPGPSTSATPAHHPRLLTDPQTGHQYSPLSTRYWALLRDSRKRTRVDDTQQSSNKRIRHDSQNEIDHLVSLDGVDVRSDIENVNESQNESFSSLLNGVSFSDGNFSDASESVDDNEHLNKSYSSLLEGVNFSDENFSDSSENEDSHDDEDPFVIESVSEELNQKYQVNQRTMKASLKEDIIRNRQNILEVLHRVFDAIIARGRVGVTDNGLMRIIIHSEHLDRVISTKFMRRDLLTAEFLLSHIERILQSHEHFVLDESFLIQIITINLPSKGAGRNPFFNSAKEFGLKKRSIITIQNNDNLCCGRALVVAKAKVDGHRDWLNIRKGRKIQERLALELYHNAEVPLGSCGLEEIRKFQDYLADYQITVVSRNQFNQIIFQGPDVQDENKNLVLYHMKDEDDPSKAHYDVITNMKGFMGRGYYCPKCHKGYNNRKDHKCENICNVCGAKDCIPMSDGKWTYCDACNRYFKSETCYQNHKNPNKFGESVCATKVKCARCNKLHFRNSEHKCWTRECKHCFEKVDMDHLCYMQPLGKRKKKKKNLKNRKKRKNARVQESESSESEESESESEAEVPPYNENEEFRLIEIVEEEVDSYHETHGKDDSESDDREEVDAAIVNKPPSAVYFFDFECTQTTGEHVPIMCSIQRQGANFGYLIKGENTARTFCRWVMRKELKDSVFIAHNFKGYDGQFILEYLVNNGIKPNVIHNGAKIMFLRIPRLNIRFIDSSNFLAMPLSKFPKTFGFEDMSKGFFPHYFTSFENMSYVGPLPDIKYYGADTMSPERRKKFMAWYTSMKQKGYIFVFMDDCVEYCVIDVRILERGFTIFQQLFKQVSKGLDPIDKCITIASSCNRLFCKDFLAECQIAIVPPCGYRFKEQQSREAVEWLNYVAHCEKTTISHAKNSAREAVVCGFKVDGFERGAPGTVYEYHGCFWHGCPKCFNPDDINPVNGTKMWELYAQTKRKGVLISEQFNYKEMWSHDWDKVKKTAEYIAYQQSTNQLPGTACERAGVSFLEPRDAFYGGRTNAVCFYAKADVEAGESLLYDDVTSLYPYVNKYALYPVGHPKVIVDDFEDIQSYFGLAKCKILPPRGLYHPVLPCRIGDKLMFPLCYTCAVNQQQKCNHTDEERSLVGTWVTTELNKAVEKGYKMVEIYEVHHFENSSDKLFTGYIDTFLKLKQESSGWPAWVADDKLSPAERLEKENEYIQKYHEREGILLDRNNIKKNPGMRALAKLCLNSFWGKFGQRNNFTKTEYVTTPARLYEIVGAKNIEVHSLNIINDDIVEVAYAYHKDFIPEPTNTNVYIAAFTTAAARLKLYSELDRLGEAVLYFDTDSIIYRCNGANRIELGDYLGDFTSEVEDHGGYIVEFCSGGPKNYSYITADGTTVCKVRGFTLNYQNQKLINFNVMKNMIMGEGPETVDIVTEQKITRDKKAKKIVNKREVKRYSLVYNKRVILDDHTTVPYGY
ncbi:uncharacterized protein LOC144926542 [Branchiostoma floridae x Branchiostoma belcheri]